MARGRPPRSFARPDARLWGVAAGFVLLALSLPLTCSGPESDGVAATRPAPADSALATRLVEAARGADPVLCGLAARALDQGWWRGGMRIEPGASDDPATGEVIDWALAPEEAAGAVRPLASALRDPDPCVRRLAARVLGRTRSAEAVAELRRALGSTASGEREMAAVGLGFAGDETAVPSLVEALGDSEPGVRIAAAWALGEIESPAAIQPLAEALMRDREAGVREAAAWALGEIE